MLKVPQDGAGTLPVVPGIQEKGQAPPNERRKVVGKSHGKGDHQSSQELHRIADPERKLPLLPSPALQEAERRQGFVGFKEAREYRGKASDGKGSAPEGFGQVPRAKNPDVIPVLESGVEQLEEKPKARRPEENERDLPAASSEEGLAALQDAKAIQQENVAPPGVDVKGLRYPANVLPESPASKPKDEDAEEEQSLPEPLLHGPFRGRSSREGTHDGR